MNIVVTGATGNIGRRVTTELASKGVSVVALARDSAKGAPLEAAGARVAVGSFEDAASLERAFSGADTLVLITAANAHADAQTSRALAAAKSAGVRKIVRVSALKADADGPTDNTRQHARTEAALKASGLTHVILRPHLFFQNLFASLPTILSEGKIYWGVGEARMGIVDTRDVADAVVVAATTDRFDGGTFELTGPASVDYHAVAAAIGRALGRDVAYQAVPPEAAAEALRRFGVDDWTVNVVRDYCTAYARGWGDFTTEDVARITGHAPRSADDFAREVLAPAARG
ncbi:MAG: NAD(P)H-binding protein [Labilithrix sp.]|nr:NAD(P)H-binding protein [Labilithrix sp.]